MKRAAIHSMRALMAVLGLCAIGRAAGPLDTQVPSDALAYMGWAGADALQAQYGQSNLKAIVSASAARDFIAQQLPKLITRAGQEDAQAPEIIAKVQTGLGIAWRHPTAFYFSPVDLSNPQRPEFRMGLLCDAGADAKALADLLNETIAKNPPPQEVPVHVSQEGALVSMTIGKAETAETRQRGGGLGAVPEYVQAMAKVQQTNAAFAVYVDMRRVLAMVGDGLEKIPNVPPEARVKVPAVIEALGLNGLTQMALASGFDGKEWSDRAFTGVKGPHKGILAMVDGPPLSEAMLAVVPKDAAAFQASKLDLHKVFLQLRDVVGTVDPNAQRELDRALSLGSQQIGMDIEADILAPLGDEWVMYRAPLSDAGGLSMAAVTKLKDGEKFTRTLAAAEELINRLGQGRFKIERTTEQKIDVSSVSYLTYSVAWTVRNGYFYVSTIDGIAGAVKQVEGKLPGIAESDLYKQAMAKLPKLPAGAKPMALSYSNPAKLYPELRRGLLGLLPLARAAGVDLPSNLLPDTADILQNLTPGASAAWWDADGMHQAGHTAFPGAQVIGGSPGGPAVVAMAAAGTAILLPSLGRAREMSQRTVDAANLKAITSGCFIYAAAHNDTQPDDLARLVLDGTIPTQVLTNPQKGTPPLVLTPADRQLGTRDFAKFAEEVAAHCDYVYLGAGTKVAGMPNASMMVLAYGKPGPHTREGLNVAYYDGHIEFDRWGTMEEQFARTNTYRKSHGLPEVDVGALMRAAGVSVRPVAPRPTSMPARRGGLP